MARTKAPVVSAALLAAFEGNLQRLGTNRANDALCDIADTSAWDGDEGIYFGALPRAIPEGVRKRIVELSKQQVAFGNEIQRMLNVLETRAEKTLDKMEREEERGKPHCKACGQVVKKRGK